MLEPRGSHDDLAALGELVARLATLRRMCWNIAESLDLGQAPVTEAATLKLLGTEFEVDVIEFARSAGIARSRHRPLFDQALLASPGFSIRGGSSDVLLSIIAKNEARS
jgi:alkylation response protein AidB-like acyl-CoA dehydrogenase